MKTKLLTRLLIVFGLAISCTFNNPSIRTRAIIVNSFSGAESFNCLFLDSSNIYLAGSVNRISEGAAVYVSSDSGSHWSTIFEANIGSVIKLEKTRNHFFIVHNFSDSLNQRVSQLMYSNSSNDWITLPTPWKLIRNLVAKEDSCLILYQENSGWGALQMTFDLGGTWSPLASVPYQQMIDYNSLLICKDSLWGLTKSGYNKDSVIVFVTDIITDSTVYYRLPSGYLRWKLTTDWNGTAILIGINNNRIDFFNINTGSGLTMTSSLELAPEIQYVDAVLGQSDTIIVFNNAKTYTHFNDYFIAKTTEIRKGDYISRSWVAPKSFRPYFARHGVICGFTGTSLVYILAD